MKTTTLSFFAVVALAASAERASAFPPGSFQNRAGFSPYMGTMPGYGYSPRYYSPMYSTFNSYSSGLGYSTYRNTSMYSTGLGASTYRNTGYSLFPATGRYGTFNNFGSSNGLNSLNGFNSFGNLNTFGGFNNGLVMPPTASGSLTTSGLSGNSCNWYIRP